MNEGLSGQEEKGDSSEVEEINEKALEEMTEDELLVKLKEVQESSDKNYDLYVRSQAEMENVKKRFHKEKSDLLKFSNETLIKQLLSVIDNLEKAIDHSGDEKALDALREGLDMTLKGLKDVLEKSGLEDVEAMGKPFDPNYHEAVSEMEDGTVESGTVIEQLQKGYLLNGRLIRPAMVIVSRKKT
jgi:molecular chaperone GrpE